VNYLCSMPSRKCEIGESNEGFCLQAEGMRRCCAGGIWRVGLDKRGRGLFLLLKRLRNRISANLS
jgi:hypothetical protein